MTALTPDQTPTMAGMPRWVKVVGIATAMIVLVVVAVLALSGGDHGPGRHSPDRHSPDRHAPSGLRDVAPARG